MEYAMRETDPDNKKNLNFSWNSCSGSPAGPRGACGSRPRRVEQDARRGACRSPAARPTGKVSTRRWGPGQGRRARRARSPTLTLQPPRPRQELKPRAAELGPRLEPPVAAARNRCPGRAAFGAQRALPGADLHLPAGARPPAEMTSLPTTPSPGEELMATPILQATEALSPEAEASTALIAVVITVVFLTLLSVVILIFFYLYKNKGSYVTYEPAEGEPGAVLQMESNSAKGREEEYFI
ncbi:small cell adhesion glycoprotein [Eubalaena glacialis]|uniref:small cell adhesion glycoprotein n=1 Tax=Eubalaena glacialis TaxID=27606 RepID=UPI002A59F87E|nr:small cell adhesion glycoprotein [Eubalaena glacialis]